MIKLLTLVILFFPFIVLGAMLFYGIIAIIAIIWEKVKDHEESPPQYSIWKEDEEEKEAMPYWIVDKLDAYDTQLESYNHWLEKLQEDYNNTWKEGDKLKIRLKQSDIMTKMAGISEKAAKLREKYNAT